MENARMCERCGVFYSPYLMTFSVGKLVRNWYSIFDLCPKCAGQLKQWFDEGSKEHGETDEKG